MITIRKKERADGSFSLYLDIHFNNTRKRETLKGLILTGNPNSDKKVMQMAESIAQKRSMQFTMAEYDFRDVYAKEEPFVPFYLAEGEKHRLLRRHNVVGIINIISPGLRFKDITKDWGEKFIAYMRKPVIIRKNQEPRPYSEVTIHSCISTLKSILNIAVERGILLKNPLNGLHLKKIKVRKEFLTLEEVDKLYNTECDYPEVKRAFLFACFTGLRLGDIIDLQYSNIQDGEIRVMQGKTDGQVSIPVTDTIMRLLNEAETLNHSGKVFNMPKRTASNNALKRWIAAAGINKKVSFHTSRHTFATMLVYYARDIFTASKLLGHSDVKITQVYAKLIDDAKITAMNSIPELRKKGL